MLPDFRRAMTLLWPHRKPLIIGLLFAIGVGTSYTFSISSVVPLLKVIFAEHETLVDWIHRVEVERRLGVSVVPDAPDSHDGLRLVSVRAESPNASVLMADDRITAIDGVAQGSYALLRILAEHPGESLAHVTVVYGDRPRTVDLRLRPHHGWSSVARLVAGWLPAGRDGVARFHVLLIVMIGLFVISVIGAVCRFLNEGLVAVAVQRAMHDLRSRLAGHVLHLPLEWHSAQPPGDTLGRFATDISKVEVGIMTLFGKVIREPIKAVGVLVLTALIDWRLLVVALLGVPIGLILMRALGRQVKKAQKRASASWGRLLDQLGEKLAGIRVVKAYSMQDEETRRFAGEGETLTRAQTQIELVDAATNPALEVLAVLGVSAFVLYGGSQVFTQQLEPHIFFAATICLAGVFDPVRKMGNVNNRLQQADASARRLFELMDLRTEEPPSTAAAEPLPPFENQIEFLNVSFSYPQHPEKRVLDEVTLTVRKGQCVALVGPNGSGKTTLMSLLMRFHTPSQGEIRIDGRDIQRVALDSLRGQIGLVTQDSVVFSDTVRANIAYGANGEATPENVEAAARMAHVDDFIQSLRVAHGECVSEGYDAFVTARSLSGGQRQRIALARAILRDPPILILDEATSQIDSESERKIQEALEDVTRNRTTFIIAHRFSTIARADWIVVLNEGRVAGQGTHDDLVASCEIYRALCVTQLAHAD